MDRVKAFYTSCFGGIAINLALSLPVLVLAVGLAVDYVHLSQQKTDLQAAADAAALASAQELRVIRVNDTQVREIAMQTVMANLDAGADSIKVDVTVSEDPLSVEVTVAKDVEHVLVAHLDSSEVSATAVARILGGTPLCVLGLNDSDTRPAIKLEVSARLTGVGCAVYSNSPAERSLVSKDGSRLEAGMICAAGGTRGSLSNFKPTPVTDCPQLDDPLANRAAPLVGNCSHRNLRIGVDEVLKVSGRYIKDQVKAETLGETARTLDTAVAVDDAVVNTYEQTFHTLEPGVYCGGIKIGQASQVTFRPGIYVIKGGPLFVTEFASIAGENVGFYFEGRSANLYLGPNTSVQLTAPSDGPMAGLLLFEDRGSTKLHPFAILSDNARVLEGTLYLPQSRLYIDADSPVADKSAYTAIIAGRLDLYAGPHLVLNTDYSATDVAVPSGISNANSRVILAR